MVSAFISARATFGLLNKAIRNEISIDHRGTGTVEEAAARIIKYALINDSGPTGRFFSEEYNPATGGTPWQKDSNPSSTSNQKI